MIDKKAIEEMAVNKVNAVLYRSKCISSTIMKSDTTPSWDGEIYLYTLGQSFSKENLIGRLSVQVKGNFVENIVEKLTVRFPVKMSDIINYYNDKRPICYFIAQISDNKSTVYYKIWETNDLEKIINKSKSQKSITLTFDKIKDIQKFVGDFKTSLNNNKIEINKVKMCDDGNLKHDKYIFQDEWKDFYVWGLDNVRVDAFIPVDYDKKLSCLIYISGHDSVSYNQDDLYDYFFCEFNKPLQERSYIQNYEESYLLILPHTRFKIDREIAEELCLILDDLYEEQEKHQLSIKNILEIDKFPISISKGQIKLLRLPTEIWGYMINFTYSHDYMDSANVTWNVFNPLNSKKHIQFYNNTSSGVKADVLAKIYVNSLESNYIDVFWLPGHTPYIKNKMEGFNDIEKWTARYTHDWILNSWIPYILYIKYIDTQKTFWKKRNIPSFDDYRKKINLNENEIYSYYLK
ncbi:hypothetical protein [Clostridium sp.]